MAARKGRTHTRRRWPATEAQLGLTVSTELYDHATLEDDDLAEGWLYILHRVEQLSQSPLYVHAQVVRLTVFVSVSIIEPTAQYIANQWGFCPQAQK